MLSSVSFGKRGINDPVDVSRPQIHVRPGVIPNPQPVVEPKKKGSTGKVIAGIIGTAVAVAGLLAAGKHFGAFNPEKLANLTKSFKDKSWIAWAKEPAKKVLKGMDTAGEYIINKGKAVYDWAAKLVKKEPKA
jgi:hypothetical protein